MYEFNGGGTSRRGTMQPALGSFHLLHLPPCPPVPGTPAAGRHRHHPHSHAVERVPVARTGPFREREKAYLLLSLLFPPLKPSRKCIGMAVC
jgi:hypothetical protein